MDENNLTENADATEAPKKRASRRVSTTEPISSADAVATSTVSASAHVNAGETGLGASLPAENQQGAPRRGRGRKATQADDTAQNEGGTETATSSDRASAQGDESGSTQTGRRTRNRSTAGDDSTGAAEGAAAENDGDTENERGGRNRNRNRNRRSNQSDGDASASRELNAGDAEGDARFERSSRNNRQRDRRRSGRLGDDFEPEILEDDVLIPIAGILDVLENYAFVRTAGYLPGHNDVYVSLGQVKKYNLRKGDAIIGSIKQPREGEGFGRQKYNALAKIDSINGQTVEQAATRVNFADLTPLYPQERIALETDAKELTTRLIDVVAPIGKGQRGLIAAPPQSGATTAIQKIANAISANNPEVHLMVVLVDGRPEDVTEMERNVAGEVIASTFDRPADDHAMVADLAIERAKRLVELGQDVCILLDSLTGLSRAFTVSAIPSGRMISGLIDAATLYPAKKFFGSARKIENGGSLTIVATVTTQSGSALDDVIFEEFAQTSNMQLTLSADLAEKRIFPAVDVLNSATRNESSIVSAAESEVMNSVRRSLAGQSAQQVLENVLDKLSHTASNVEFLTLANKSTASE